MSNIISGNSNFCKQLEVKTNQFEISGIVIKFEHSANIPDIL